MAISPWRPRNTRAVIDSLGSAMRATIAQEFRRVHRCLCLSAAAAASAEALLHRATGETRPVAHGTLVGGSPRRSLPLLGGTGRRLSLY
jgi:hypothetical protein